MNRNILHSAFLHPCLFVLFPLVFVFTNNQEFLSLDQLILPTIIFFGIIIAVLLSVYFIFKNNFKITIIVSVGLVIFFTYGHFYDLFHEMGIEITNKVLIPIFLLLFLICSLFLLKSKSNFKDVTKIINAIGITILLLSLVNLINFDIDESISSLNTVNEELYIKYHPPPDVFYIILDAYGGHDTLLKYYDFDNNNFINELRERGFHVVEQSRSNYAWTYLSLASSLNMNYHTSFDLQSSNAYEQVYNKISENQVMNNFKNLGYKVVNFDSGWGTTRDIKYADETFCGSLRSIGDSQILISILDNSILKPIYAKIFVDDRRSKVLCQFENIPNTITNNEQPVFVFAHIISPHKPYIFGKNGEILETKSLSQGETDYRFRDFRYIEQLQFVNHKTLSLVDTILEKSKTQPIIIIQSDHGSEFPIDADLDDKIKEKMTNFNSYLLPHGGNSILYDDVTPVNTFRLIFNYYFNGTYQTLEDRSYWSEFNPFELDNPEFIDVTQKLN